MFYIYEKFHENISKSFQLTERTWVHGRNGYVQRSKGRRRLIMLYICVKFRENITNGIRVTEQTRVHGRNGYVQHLKGNDSKRRQTRVVVHVFCTSSNGTLHCCEVSWKDLRWYQLCSRHEIIKRWRTDGQMDTQNFGRYSIIPRHFLWQGIKTRDKYIYI